MFRFWKVRCWIFPGLVVKQCTDNLSCFLWLLAVNSLERKYLPIHVTVGDTATVEMHFDTPSSGHTIWTAEIPKRLVFNWTLASPFLTRQETSNCAARYRNHYMFHGRVHWYIQIVYTIARDGVLIWFTRECDGVVFSTASDYQAEWHTASGFYDTQTLPSLHLVRVCAVCHRSCVSFEWYMIPQSPEWHIAC